MRYYSLALVFLLLLGLTACDRFGRDEQEIDFYTELFNPIQASMDSPAELDALMDFYHEDYVYNALDKAGRRAFFESLWDLYGDDIVLEPVVQGYNPSGSAISWELRVMDASSKDLAVFAFTDEKLLKVDGEWKLYGNQISDIEQGERQRIIFESFTFTTCPNCPEVEELMHSLAAQYPAQFSYIEYHIGDPLAIPSNNDIFGYYGYSAMPATVLQGIEKRIGADPETLDGYLSFVLGMLDNTPQVFLEDPQYSVAGNTLSGSISIRCGGLDQSDLKLRYHLIEKASSATNSAGAPCTNVVLASGTMDLEGANLNQRQDFVLSAPGELPSDLALVIYVQQMPATFENNAMIHNGIEIPIH